MSTKLAYNVVLRHISRRFHFYGRMVSGYGRRTGNRFFFDPDYLNEYL